MGGAVFRRPGYKENRKEQTMDKATDRVLFLILTEHWFDEIKSGRKTHEYREAREYWNKRLTGKRYTHVALRRAYGKGAEVMIFKIDALTREHNIPNDLRAADVWDIKLGERVK